MTSAPADPPSDHADSSATMTPLAKALSQALGKARACHQAGELAAAEQLYQAILGTQPQHAAANYGLGMLRLQQAQAVAAVAYLQAALEAEPQAADHWLAYIDALLATGDADGARQALDLGRRHGLAGAAVESLAQRLASPTEEAAAVSASPAATATPGVDTRRRPDGRRGKKTAGRRPPLPFQRTLAGAIALANDGKLHDAEARARSLIECFPQRGEGWKVLGAVLKMQARNDEALAALQRAVDLLPDDPQALANLGVALTEAGDLAAAEDAQRSALTIQYDFPEAHFNLGNVLYALGRIAEAEDSFHRALELRPDFALAHCNLGNCLLQQNRPDEAAASYRLALAQRPELAEAHYNLADLLCAQGRRPEAEAELRLALRYRPDFPQALYNLGNTLNELGRSDEAEAAWRQAIACQADFPEALAALGSLLAERRCWPEAEAALRSALRLRPGLPEAHYNLASALGQQGRLREAEDEWRQALACKADFPEALVGLGIVLKQLGQLPAAEENLRRALAIRPDLGEAHNTLGAILRDQHRLTEAEASLHRALAIKPELAGAWLNLGVTCADLGRHEEAERACRRALALQPDYWLAHSNLLYCLTHNERCSAGELFAEHLRFAELFEAPLRNEWLPHGNTREAERRLQIGFVSGDLRHHAVASFLEPVLTELARYPTLVLHAYSNYPLEDEVSDRLRQYFTNWQAVAGIADDDLAQRIRADGIDILIDLSGHTGHHRLLTFARKPAPIQASWIGYPGTTGLQSIDYFLADRFFLPVGEFDDQFTETIVRLPASAPFLPSADAPAVGPLPALACGHLTFGSFNRPTKISPAVVALWCQLLRALPGSRMLLAAMRPDGRAEQLAGEFAENGIARERLLFQPRSDMRTYLELHQQVDICLDTFPYTGGTTTLHACWMGVPTLTLAGATVPGRAAASTLGHVGLPGFIAPDANEFVTRGREWAADLEQLATLRAGLRERLQQSALGHPELVAAGLERTFRMIWQRWCQGLAPRAFEITANDLTAQARP